MITLTRWGGSRRPLLMLAALLVAGTVTIGAPHGAWAAKGVSIDLGRVTIRQPVRAGDGLDLPRFTVANPGDDAATYVVSVGGVGSGDGLAPAASWFTFNPAEFTLEPGQTQSVTARLDVPGDASTGSYVGLVRAQLAAEGEGTLLGAAAAGLLRFEVDGALPGETSGADGNAGIAEALANWRYLLVALAALVLVAAVSRRYRITIGRR